MKKHYQFAVLTVLAVTFLTPRTSTLLEATSPLNIDLISVGAAHGLLLTEDNQLYSWGGRFNGTLGDGVTTGGTVNRLINITESGDLSTHDYEADPIIQIEANNAMSAALSQSGLLYLWGNNEAGSIGNGTTNHQYAPLLVNNFGALATLASGDYLIKISLNEWFNFAFNSVLALSSTGKLLKWGSARNGLGANGDTTPQLLPVDITTAGALNNLTGGDKIVSISSGLATSGVVTQTGRIFTWGTNSSGRVVGSTSYTDSTFTVTSPVEITSSNQLSTLSGLGDKAVSIEMGGFTGSVLTEQGRLFVWGLNTEGQGAQGTRSQYIYPTDITNQGALGTLDTVNGETILTVKAGYASFNALTSTGTIIAWGINNGKLGDGTSDAYVLTPVEIQGIGDLATLTGGEKVVQLSRNYNTAIAVTDQDNVYGWGNNEFKLYFGSNMATATGSVDLGDALIAGLREPYAFIVDDITALPATTDLTLTNESAVVAIRTAYDALTPEEQALVTNLETLIAAEEKMDALNQTAADLTAANAVIALIDAFPETNAITLEDEADIEAASLAFNNLTDAQQQLVTNVADLNNAIDRIEELNTQATNQAAADAVIALIEMIPSLEDLTLADANTVSIAVDAYNALTNAQKDLIGVEYIDVLDDSLGKLSQLETEAADLAAATDVIEMIDALPDAADLTLEDEPAVTAAQDAYNGLTQTQKGLVTNHARLLEVVTQLETLQNASSGFSWWWLLLLTLIPIGYYAYKKRKESKVA